MILTPVMQKYVLHWGEMGTRWGVNRSIAQIHALLYLSPQPLTADEIADTLSIARSNVSTSLKELQGWGMIRMVHVLGDRREHFEAIQEITQLFRVIVEERKRRELDPTIALLREVMNDPDARTPAHVRQRVKSPLTFLEMLDSWYEDIKGLPHPLFIAMLKMGARIQKFLSKEAA